MGTMPNPNLPNEATPWGKWVIGQIESLLDSAGRRNLNATNSGKAQNATTEALGDQIQGLQATIASVASIAANQVTPAVSSNSAVNFVLTTSFQSLTSVSLTVPAGYTRAVVTANGSVTGAGNAGGDRLYAHCTIAGVAGVDMGTVITGFGNVACSASAVLAGLAGGSSLVVDVSARLGTGPGSNLADYAQVTATVLFLK